jgi:gamma-glutamyl:cysteine ligase YbdK (ATP-grasp superfamily)
LDTLRPVEPLSLGLFEAYGIELEYMLVDENSLSVLPIADRVLEAAAGEPVIEVEMGEAAWSNELALHVIEMKTNGPRATLECLAPIFQQNVRRINDLAASLGGRLMPTAMHPWMDPHSETRLWPHEQGPVYQAFDRIFGCQGHGWSNLQSTHINLPFAGDRQFGRLHAAIRLVLPILAGLAASSPIVERRATGALDNRLDVYRSNAARIPSVSGMVIPEPVYTRREYEEHLLGTIYRDLQPFDPHGILRHEWVNARGAIARFDRNAIEIRVLDIQECPAADLALGACVVAAVRALVEEAWCDTRRQQAWDTARLHHLFLATMADADQAVIEDTAYLSVFGYPEGGRCRVRELWQHLAESLLADGAGADDGWPQFWRTYFSEGTLARRILTAVDLSQAPDPLHDVYRSLCDCLAEGRVFSAGA